MGETADVIHEMPKPHGILVIAGQWFQAAEDRQEQQAISQLRTAVKPAPLAKTG